MSFRVRLTDEEQRMLAGDFGAAKSKALQFIAQYADALGAERLVEIRKAQIFVGAHHYLRTLKSTDIDEVISEMYLGSSEKVILEKVGCFTQMDVVPLDPDSRFRKSARGCATGKYIRTSSSRCGQRSLSVRTPCARALCRKSNAPAAAC